LIPPEKALGENETNKVATRAAVISVVDKILGDLGFRRKSLGSGWVSGIEVDVSMLVIINPPENFV